MPGWPCTNESASAARVPLPLRRPARRLAAGRPGLAAGRTGLCAEAFARAPVAVRFEPGGRPGPRRAGAIADSADRPIFSSAAAASVRRWCSSTAGLSSLSRWAISLRVPSRKSGTASPLSRGLSRLSVRLDRDWSGIYDRPRAFMRSRDVAGMPGWGFYWLGGTVTIATATLAERPRALISTPLHSTPFPPVKRSRRSRGRGRTIAP
jgi:hypothetical protein